MGMICITACADLKEARKIAKTLLQKRLVGCVNIVPRIESHYWWKGRMEKTSEALLIMKTREGLRKQVEKEIERLHSYELPVMDFFATRMNKEAAKWLKGETK